MNAYEQYLTNSTDQTNVAIATEALSISTRTEFSTKLTKLANYGRQLCGALNPLALKTLERMGRSRIEILFSIEGVRLCSSQSATVAVMKRLRTIRFYPREGSLQSH